MLLQRAYQLQSSCFKFGSVMVQIARLTVPAAPQIQNELSNIADPVQKSLMSEKYILVDEWDNPVGSESKLGCHSVATDGTVKLHRGFSTFLFNSEGKMLIHRRSKYKVTFPNRWTNTCCSHPLFPSEADGINGIQRAACRRVEYEMGITGLAPSDFRYLTRFHYFALSDDKWGEHEIGYLLFVQKDVVLNINENEVDCTRYVTLDELQRMDPQCFIPWFRLILETKLSSWWKQNDFVQYIQNDSVIHRL